MALADTIALAVFILKGYFNLNGNVNKQLYIILLEISVSISEDSYNLKY